MKLTALLVFIFTIQASAYTDAQTVSYSGKNVSLRQVFSAIKKQTGYLVVFNANEIQKAKPITVAAKDEQLTRFLQMVLEDQPLDFTIEKRTIVLVTKSSEMKGKGDVTSFLEMHLPPPPLAIHGMVKDENGNALSGVSVAIKNTSKATVTNSKGEYDIIANNESSQLVFSFIGYETFEITVKKNTIINISLKPDVKKLEDMIVVGYTAKKSSEITGSLQKISGQELNQGVSSANTLAMLKGKIGGLYIVEPSGSVAQRGQVVMHGQASFNDNSNNNFGPLIVLDGVITTATSLQDIVDATDIESITVLKDASSTAIYGSRAAQGVIMVVTKRGSTSSPLKVTLGMNYGNVQNNRLVNFMNTSQLTSHINQYMQSLYNGTPSLQTTYGSFQNYFNTTRIYKDADLNNSYDWNNNAFFSNGNQSDVNLALSSGNDKTRFYSSINWIKQDGSLLDDNLDRKSFRVNLDQKISNKLSLSFNTNVIVDKYTATASETQYYLFQPWVSPNYANGNLADSVPNTIYKPTGATVTEWYDNPLYSHSYDNTITLRQNYLGTGKLKYNILPWLSVQTTNTFQYTYNNVNSYKDPRTYRGRYDGPASNRIFVNGLLSITDTRNTYFLTSNILNFNKRFGKHTISALIGQEYGRIHAETFAATAYNNSYPGERNLGAFKSYGTYSNAQSGTVALPSAAAPVDKASFSVFSELNENYNDKYFASASVRRDASTNFGIDKRYGTFYSFSGGWQVSKESFMHRIKPISNLKLRASFGTSGREAGADYLNFTVYQDVNRYNDLNTFGSNIQRLGNDQITWETTYNTNLGIDIGLWKNRVNLSIDLYRRRSAGLLQTVTLPSFIGFTSQLRNIGELTNKGMDILLSTQNMKSRNFSWTTDFNINFNQNRLTEIYGDSLRDGFGGGYYRYKGEDLNVIKAIRFAGVNPDNGRPMFERIMSDKSITLVDSIALVTKDGLLGYQTMGSATPKFYGGITNTFKYKGLTLSVLFNFVYGNKIMNNAIRNFLSPSAWQSGFNLPQPNSAIRFWQGPGDKNANYSNYYDLAFAQRGLTNIASSRLVVDASYIRLRNIRLGYEIPAAVLSKLKISSANIYLSADNVFVIASKDLYASDPEGATIGSTSTIYSGTGIASGMPRKLLFGINIGF